MGLFIDQQAQSDNQITLLALFVMILQAPHYSRSTTVAGPSYRRCFLGIKKVFGAVALVVSDGRSD